MTEDLSVSTTHGYHVEAYAYQAGYQAYEMGLQLEDAWEAYKDGEADNEEPVTIEEKKAYAKGWCEAWIDDPSRRLTLIHA